MGKVRALLARGNSNAPSSLFGVRPDGVPSGVARCRRGGASGEWVASWVFVVVGWSVG